MANHAVLAKKTVKRERNRNPTPGLPAPGLSTPPGAPPPSPGPTSGHVAPAPASLLARAALQPSSRLSGWPPRTGLASGSTFNYKLEGALETDPDRRLTSGPVSFKPEPRTSRTRVGPSLFFPRTTRTGRVEGKDKVPGEGGW